MARSPDRDAARALNESGNEADERGDRDAALRSYTAAVEADPTYATAWFNVGLEHKRRHDWRPSRDANRKALELATDGDLRQSAAWNLGIAATALADWPTAFVAWRALGVPVERAPDGSPAYAIGATPIRIVGPDGATEVVWTRRFDPVRARITSVPTPESGHRHGDVVPHDAEPKGKRELHGRMVSVFDELERLESSLAETWVVDVTAPSPDDVEALMEIVHAVEGHAAEDWTSSLQILCKECSLGEPHPAHEPHAEPPWATARRVALVCVDPARMTRSLADWARGRGRAWRDLQRLT